MIRARCSKERVSSYPCPADPRGFTLIEVTIVLLVISIITALAVPRLIDALSYHRIEAAAQRVRRDLELARRIAQTRSASQSVQFDAANNLYDIPGLADFDRSGQSYRVRLDQSPTTATTSAVDFGGDGEVIFNGYGLPDTSGSVTIRVGGYQRVVVVEPDGCVVVQ